MKKFLTWDCILAVVLFVGLAIVSGAFIHYSYAWADEYSELLKYAMRVVGFIGIVFFPTKLVAGFMEIINSDVIDDLQESYNALWQESHHGMVARANSAHTPDDEDYKEED